MQESDEKRTPQEAEKIIDLVCHLIAECSGLDHGTAAIFVIHRILTELMGLRLSEICALDRLVKLRVEDQCLGFPRLRALLVEAPGPVY
jgi:hypothetical protein